jgi:Flp pilus assembly protein CpaB
MSNASRPNVASVSSPRAVHFGGRASLVAGGLLALITGGLIYMSLQVAHQQAPPAPPEVVVVPVVISSADIPVGTPLTEAVADNQFTLSRLPSASVPEDALTTLASLDGRTTIQALHAGDIVRASSLATTAPTTTSGSRLDLLPPGYVAIALPANDQITVGGAVVPSDHVDLIADVPVGSGPGGSVVVTQALLRDVRVLATGFRTRPAVLPTPAAGASASADPPAPSPYSTITLALRPQDAIMVQHLLAQNVRIAFALRRPDDAPESTAPVTTAAIARAFNLSVDRADQLADGTSPAKSPVPQSAVANAPSDPNAAANAPAAPARQ